MINNDQSTLLLLYCCQDVKSRHSGGDTSTLKFHCNEKFVDPILSATEQHFQ